MTTRRTVLKTMMTASALSLWDAPLRFAFAKVSTDRRLVVVILRGALDGMAAVPPFGDPDYASVRGALALDKSGTGALLNLDGFFGLHPGLDNLKAMYEAREAAIFHNIASPYRDRSHFDGQNVLETGGASPHLLQDGWLNRALVPMGLGDGEKAVAVAQTPPLLLDGAARATSWMPATMPTPDAVFLGEVRKLYAKDAVLSASLASAMEMAARAKAATDDASASTAVARPGAAGYGNLTPLFGGAGRLLADPRGPRVAVLDAGGWDTHFNEGTADGQLARRLRALDTALDAMKSALGLAWSQTTIVVATEFGRTVRPNGTAGTDHGTGSVAFLLGGAVNGGAVHAEWVGLNSAALQDGRDQPARTDLRALFKGVLADHMGVSRNALDTEIFPDSASISPLAKLIRA
ncbi:MAG: DUF1501 domain-containing protein [Alphaproteobacteria bacterium]|nr:DUF1501 domain-containing protein [Alphaproteobacteria bacterium]